MWFRSEWLTSRIHWASDVEATSNGMRSQTASGLTPNVAPTLGGGVNLSDCASTSSTES